jgi:hypothetical protein
MGRVVTRNHVLDSLDAPRFTFLVRTNPDHRFRGEVCGEDDDRYKQSACLPNASENGGLTRLLPYSAA